MIESSRLLARGRNRAATPELLNAAKRSLELVREVRAEASRLTDGTLAVGKVGKGALVGAVPDNLTGSRE